MISETGNAAFYILGVVLVYYIYYYSANSGFLKRLVEERNFNANKELSLFFARKFTGFIFLGIIPGIIYFILKYPEPMNFGISFRHFTANITIILFLVVLIISTAYLHQKLNPDFTAVIVKSNLRSFQVVVFNLFGWAIYLVAYEFLFRGILLFECYYAFGLWPAVVINVAFYSAIHMPEGKDQVIGALIFGTVAGYFALTRGTILIPVFMHLALNISTILFSIHLTKNVKPDKLEY